MKKIALLVTCLILIFHANSYAQVPPPSQTAGGIEKTAQDIQKEKALEKRITTPKKVEEEAVEEKAAPVEEGAKILVTDIEVKDATLVSADAINKIITPYKGKELTVGGMQKICDLITDEYRKSGRVTSRAYLPPQKIKDGHLIIMVIEGKLGNVEVKGNRYFSSTLIKKKLQLKPGEYFDYRSLQRALTKLNEHPDRFVKSVLAPGKEAGTTDIVLEVDDSLPAHISYEFDNFGSRYIEHQRHTGTVEHNNFLGLDDKLSFRYQKGQCDFYDFYNFRYVLPLLQNLESSFYYLWNNVKLAKEYKAEDVRGQSQFAGAAVSYTIIDLSAVNMKVNGGFDYKHVSNSISGTKTSRDEARVLKVGIDLDIYDRWGRTIITLEEDIGLNFGGLHKKDPLATRPGAGAEFCKLVGNLYRLQPMPFSSTILWKNSFQASNYNLLAVEQFQIGGISNVRGYAPAEYSGDAGYTTTVEWSFPIYGLPKDIKVPLSKSTLYDAIRIVGFYDMGYVHIKSPSGSDKQDRTVQGYGAGIRFNLPEDFSARFESAWRFSSKAAFSDANLYIDVGKKF
jgi:hemolysin activation/secretion protein